MRGVIDVLLAMTWAVGPSGERLQSGGRLHIGVWRRTTSGGTAYTTIKFDPYRRTIGFDPTGRRLITGHPDGSAKVWDPEGTLTAELRGHPTFVFDARFSPDGTTIVSAGLDGGIVLWDARTGRQIGRHVPNPAGGPALAWFGPDGTSILSPRLDEHAVWDIPADADVWLRRACSIAGRDLTPEEWARFLPARAYEPVCT